ncbi:MAG: cache domain-containing protein, partial [Pseudomonadota bacterium]
MSLSTSKFFSRVPLRRKLVFWFIMAALLPLITAGYLSYHTISSQAEASAAREMITAAETAGKAASEFVDSRCGEILIWSRLRLVREALELAEIREEVSENLGEMVEVSGVYDAIAVVGDGGKCVATSKSELFGVDFSTKEEFVEARSGKFSVGALQKTRHSGKSDSGAGAEEWVLAIAAPIKAQDKVKGVFTAYLRWKSLEDLLTSTKVAQSGYLFVIDKDGRFIVHPDRSLYGKQMTVGTELAALGA